MLSSTLFGIAGLLAIITGVLVRHRQERDLLYIAGGVMLTIYSVALGDLIFILLQIVFTLVAIYDYLLNRRKKR